MNENPHWLDLFYKDRLVCKITKHCPYDGGDDLILQAFEICHGIFSFALDYNNASPQIQSLWDFLGVHNYVDPTDHNWEENPYGKAVYDFLVEDFGFSA